MTELEKTMAKALDCKKYMEAMGNYGIVFSDYERAVEFCGNDKTAEEIINMYFYGAYDND